MNQSYTANPGVSLPSISLGSGMSIKGIKVDNPSGGWLYIVETKDYVPPYTHDWARTLEYAGQAVSVIYGQSPAKQVSTQQGDPYTITLYDSSVPDGPGDPTFIPVTQSAVAIFFFGMQFNVFGQVLIPAVPNKVIRLLYVTASYQGLSDIPCFITLLGAGGFILLQLAGISKPSDTFIFPDKGLFLPQGNSLSCNVQLWPGWPAVFPFGTGVEVSGQYAYV